ncbi:hypothetical protein G7046_g832 [Stylonectria norvegica]|nr:hypothetical protein G7046_g832 [Stylonectria norvegica]
MRNADTYEPSRDGSARVSGGASSFSRCPVSKIQHQISTGARGPSSVTQQCDRGMAHFQTRPRVPPPPMSDTIIGIPGARRPKSSGDTAEARLGSADLLQMSPAAAPGVSPVRPVKLFKSALLSAQRSWQPPEKGPQSRPTGWVKAHLTSAQGDYEPRSKTRTVKVSQDSERRESSPVRNRQAARPQRSGTGLNSSQTWSEQQLQDLSCSTTPESLSEQSDSDQEYAPSSTRSQPILLPVSWDVRATLRPSAALHQSIIMHILYIIEGMGCGQIKVMDSPFTHTTTKLRVWPFCLNDDNWVLCVSDQRTQTRATTIHTMVPFEPLGDCQSLQNAYGWCRHWDPNYTVCMTTPPGNSVDSGVYILAVAFHLVAGIPVSVQDLSFWRAFLIYLTNPLRDKNDIDRAEKCALDTLLTHCVVGLVSSIPYPELQKIIDREATKAAERQKEVAISAHCVLSLLRKLECRSPKSADQEVLAYFQIAKRFCGDLLGRPGSADLLALT